MKKFIFNLIIAGGVILGGIHQILMPNLSALAADVGGGSSGVELPEIYIAAVNPGYTVDKISNVGEMIAIARRDKSDTPISLANYSIGYTNSSGKTIVLVDFPEFWMVGEGILLRLASSPESELANMTYSKTLAMKAGPLTLMRDGEVVDSVCWTGGDGCVKEFKSANPTVLVRDTVTGEFAHVAVDEYEVKYDAEAGYVDEGYGGEDAGDDAVVKQCVGLEFSEILTYYAETKDEQFVELYNTNSEQILLDGCKVRYKNKMYALTGVVKPEEYLTIQMYEKYGVSFTKNPTNSNTLEIIDADGTVVDTLEYYNGQKKGTAWAWIGYDAEGKKLWRTTYVPTPGEPNNYQEYKTCEEGKVINEATGNCVKVTTVEEKICAVGQYLNLLTNRCKKVEEAKTTTCKEGYYYYEGTGRCRKIVENTGANYSVVAEEYEENSTFVALYAVAGVVGVGVVYIVYEFRRSIMKTVRRVVEKVVKK